MDFLVCKTELLVDLLVYKMELVDSRTTVGLQAIYMVFICSVGISKQ